MPASTILSSVRQPLATAFAGVTANVYDHVPEFPPNPFVVIVPNDPYMEIDLIGKTQTKVKLNFVITCGVQNADNAAALDNLEQLIISILAAIPSGYEISSVNSVGPRTVGNGSSLMAEIAVSTHYTQTN
jgi:hypothetical protein